MGDAHEQITELEAEIDDLHDQLQRCRKIELAAKAVFAAGCATLALGLFWNTPISFVIAIGAILGSVYDGGNRMWVWSSRLSEDTWGWGTTADAAKHGLEAWLRAWLENFRPLLN